MDSIWDQLAFKSRPLRKQDYLYASRVEQSSNPLEEAPPSRPRSEGLQESHFSSHTSPNATSSRQKSSTFNSGAAPWTRTQVDYPGNDEPGAQFPEAEPPETLTWHHRINPRANNQRGPEWEVISYDQVPSPTFVEEMVQSISPAGDTVTTETWDGARAIPEVTTSISTSEIPALDYTTTPSAHPMIWYLSTTADVSPFACRLQKLARRSLPFIVSPTAGINQRTPKHKDIGYEKYAMTHALPFGAQAPTMDPVVLGATQMSLSAGALTRTGDHFSGEGAQSKNTLDGPVGTFSDAAHSLLEKEASIEEIARLSPQIAGPSMEILMPHASMGTPHSPYRNALLADPLLADHLAPTQAAIIPHRSPIQDNPTEMDRDISPKPTSSLNLSLPLEDLQILPSTLDSDPVESNNMDTQWCPKHCWGPHSDDPFTVPLRSSTSRCRNAPAIEFDKRARSFNELVGDRDGQQFVSETDQEQMLQASDESDGYAGAASIALQDWLRPEVLIPVDHGSGALCRPDPLEHRSTGLTYADP